MVCCTGDSDCCQNSSFDGDDSSVFTSNNIDLGAGTGDFINLTTTFNLDGCSCNKDKCQFCGCDSVKTVYFNSGQRLYLCQKHLDEIKNSIGDVIRYVPQPVNPNPWDVPYYPPGDYPSYPYTPITCDTKEYYIIDYHLAGVINT